MPIKLLSKQEISQKQVLQKRIEIEEGRKLAKRVDNLRELAVEEEASLASFRANFIKALNEDIKKITKERDSILVEIQTLRNELGVGFSELKKAEKVLSLKEENYVSREKQLEERLDLIENKEKQLKQDIDNISTLNIRLDNIRISLIEMNEKAEMKMKEADYLFEKATSEKTENDRLLQGISETLHNKDINIASRERDITIKEERIIQQELILRERELQLRDREQTLERDLIRLNKIKT